MRIKKALFSLFLLTNLLFVPSVFAGGGPVQFTIDPDQSLNPGEQYIVHAQVYIDGQYPTYCKNCFIKLALDNPQDDDYIVQNDNVTNDDGRIYAKVISKVAGNRVIYVSELRNADGARITADSIVVLNYTGESLLPSRNPKLYLTPPSTPTPSPTPQPIPEGSNFYVKVGVQRYTDGPKRYIYLSWSQVQNTVKYNVYARLADTNTYGAALLGTGSLSTELGINAFMDYYVKVDACSNPGVCIGSNEIFVPAMSQVTSPPKPSTPGGDIYLKVGVQRYVGEPKRYVYLSWNKVEGAVKYNVYTRLSDMNEYGAAIVGTGSLSTEIGINAFLDYYAKVNACNSVGCISSSEVFIPRMKKEEGGVVVAPSPSTVITVPPTNNSNVEELNKKVGSLQNQLEASKKKQNTLEQRINDLVSFIKRFFPFFR